jgi:hypothetical protein
MPRMSMLVDIAIPLVVVMMMVVGVALLGHTEFVLFAAAFIIIQAPLLMAAVAYRRQKSGKLGATWNRWPYRYLLAG